MAAEIANVFREDLQSLVVGSKLLVVGAGGIGCEILKNLVMCGFKDIEIVRISQIFASFSLICL
jgi:ubiquitin-like 1-activating enzyme E1 B